MAGKDVKSAITECFGALDQDNNGKIDKKELCVLFRAVFQMPKDAPIPDELISAIMKEADKDGSGAITQNELGGAVNCLMTLQLAFTLEHHFRQLDKDGNGYLDKRELTAMVKDHTKGEDQKKLAKFLGDMPDDAKITKQQFMKGCFSMIAH